MNIASLRLLTWGTIAGSVTSALLVAAMERRAHTTGGERVERAASVPVAERSPAFVRALPALPTEPTRAGSVPAAGRSREAPRP